MVYRQVQVLKRAAGKSRRSGKAVAIVSYDEKAGNPGRCDDEADA